MESKDKYIFLFICFIFMFVLLLVGIISQSNYKCYAGDPPGPDPTPCCPEGYNKEPEWAITIEDPKSGEDVTKLLGVITDVSIGGPTCVEYNEPITATYTANGGDDKDVCVNEDDPNVAYEYNVPESVTWSGTGYQDPNDLRKFYFTPSAPSDENPCDSYTVEVEVDGTGDCNVGNEAIGDSVDVKVWKEVMKIESSTGLLLMIIFVGEPGVGFPIFLGYPYEATDKYKDRNGDFKGKEQWLSLTFLDDDYDEVFSANHDYWLDELHFSFVDMYVHPGLDPHTIVFCSFDQSEFQYWLIENCDGIESIFEASVVVSQNGNVLGTDSDECTLIIDTEKCCP